MKTITFPVRVALVLLTALCPGCGKDAGSTPTAAWEGYRDAIVAKDWDAVWEVMPPESQKGYQGQLDGMRGMLDTSPEGAEIMLKNLGLTAEELKSIDVKSFFKKQMSMLGTTPAFNEANQLKDSKVTNVVEDGDTATITVQTGDGKSIPMQMKRVDGKWRISSGGR